MGMEKLKGFFGGSSEENKENRNINEDEYYDESWDDEEAVRQIDYHNKEQRTDYVKNCLEKMADATKELENLNF